MAYSIERMPERISIGRETETGVTDVMIDCGAWVSKWPGMALHAIYTPEGGAPYILQTETDGGVLVWHVTDADTATPGTGSMEIVGETDGRRKVSATVKVSVAARMSGTVGVPPEAAKPWADRVVEAAERITGMKVQAETLDAGSGARAEWDGEQGLLTIGVPKGKDGKDAVVDATLTQSGQAADAKATGDALAYKMTEPSEGLAVGRYFRIASLDESGHAVLEAVDAAQIGVQDVQVAGASVVTDGVANVPNATNNAKGVVSGNTSIVDSNFAVSGGSPYCMTRKASDFYSQGQSGFVSNGTLRNVLTAPSLMPSLTADEQAAARERMGLPGDYELIEKITLEEEVNKVERSAKPDGTSYNFISVFIKVYVPASTSSGTMDVRYYIGYNSIIAYISNAINIQERYGVSKAEKKYGYFEAYGCNAGSTTNTAILSLTGTTYSEYMTKIGTIEKIALNLQGGKMMPIGTEIEIYGVRE